MICYSSPPRNTNSPDILAKEDTPESFGHENKVLCVVVSHDSARAVTSSLDGTIIVWDTANGTVLREWTAHEKLLLGNLTLSADSRWLISAESCDITVWDIDFNLNSDAAPPKAAVLEGHTNMINSSAWSPDHALIASASMDRTVRIWDGYTYQQRDLLELQEGTSPWKPSSLQFSPSSRYLAWISGGTACCLWRPLTGEEPKTLSPHPDRRDIRTTAFSFDHKSRCIATAHGNWCRDPYACVVRIWEAATGTALAVLTGHSKIVRHISFSPEGRSLFSMADDMSMRVWDFGTRSGDSEAMDVFRLAKSLSSGGRYCVRPDGKYIATGSVQGLVRLWRKSDGRCIAKFREHDHDTGSVTHITFSPNGKFLVSGNTNGVVHIRCISRFIRE